MGEAIRTKAFTIDRAAYLKAMWARGLWGPTARFGAVVVVFLGICATFVGPAPLQGGIPVLILVLAAGIGARYLRAKRNVYGRVGRKVFDDPRTMAFSETGADTKTEGGAEGRVPWSHVVLAERRGGFTLLFTGRIVHLIVPDDAFATETDRRAFWEILERHELLPPV